MNTFKEKVVREIIRLGKKNHSLRMPALALAALFLMAYHSVRSFFLEFQPRYDEGCIFMSRPLYAED